MAAEPGSKESEIAIEDAKHDSGPGKKAKTIAIEQARAATDKEHRMSLWQGIRTYPKAILWSMLVTLCIAMEGFDLVLLNTFCTSAAPLVVDHVQLIRVRWPTAIPKEVRRRGQAREIPNTRSVASWTFQWTTGC